MAPMSNTIEIDRPPEAVYAFATDPTHFPAWQRDVIRVQMLDEEEFATVRRVVGAERTTLQRITANEPPRHGPPKASTAPSGPTPPSRSSRSTTAPGRR